MMIGIWDTRKFEDSESPAKLTAWWNMPEILIDVNHKTSQVQYFKNQNAAGIFLDLYQNNIAFQPQTEQPRTRYTDTLSHHTVCLRIDKCEVRTLDRPAAEQQSLMHVILQPFTV